jgi:hypothetical protein
MLKDICLGFGLEPKSSRNAQERMFNDFLVKQYAQDKNIILFIDEAQNLDNKIRFRARHECEPDNKKE